MPSARTHHDSAHAGRGALTKARRGPAPPPAEPSLRASGDQEGPNHVARFGATQPVKAGRRLVANQGRLRTSASYVFLMSMARVIGPTPPGLGVSHPATSATPGPRSPTCLPPTQFVPGGNPYLSQHPTVVNPATYLGGGRDFGAFPDPAGPFPHIVSRNLTPDNSGLPEGGNTFDQFLQIMRTGKDFDHLHPNCSATVTTNCFPPVPPVNGDLLQVMPWPIHKNMTEHDLRAIYEYLSAIPCIAGPPSPSPLHNDCN